MTLQRTVQITCLTLFLGLLISAAFRFVGWLPHDLFLRLDPAAALLTGLSARIWLGGFAAALAVLVAAGSLGAVAARAEEEDPRQELVERLLEYRRIKEAAQSLAEIDGMRPYEDVRVRKALANGGGMPSARESWWRAPRTGRAGTSFAVLPAIASGSRLMRPAISGRRCRRTGSVTWG